MKLTLVLTYHWFDEIASGRKRIEYRATTKTDGTPSKWFRCAWQNRDEIETVQFMRGYTATKSEVFSVTEIDIGPCPYDGWGGNYYRIHFEQKD